MTTPSVLPEGPERSQTKKFRRQVWLQIYFPIALGIFILGILTATLLINQSEAASVWGDASLIMLFIPVIILGLILLFVLIALSYLIARLIGALPAPLSSLYMRMEDLDRASRRVARTISKPFMFPSAVKAAIGTAVRSVFSIFERRY